MIVEARNRDLDLMGLDYSDMDVLTEPDDYIEIMGMDEGESYIVPREIVETIDGMPDEDIVNDLVEYPELMGAFFRRILRKRKRRRKLMKRKMRGMSKRQRRKYKKRLRRKRRRKITRQIMLRFAPGGRIIRALKAKKKIKRLRRAKKKRLAAKRAKRRAARPKAPVAPQAPEMEIYQEPAPQVYERKRRSVRQETSVLPPEYDEPGFEESGEVEMAPQAPAPAGEAMKKMLPLAAIAGAGLLLMTMKKK